MLVFFFLLKKELIADENPQKYEVFSWKCFWQPALMSLNISVARVGHLRTDWRGCRWVVRSSKVTWLSWRNLLEKLCGKWATGDWGCAAAVHIRQPCVVGDTGRRGGISSPCFRDCPFSRHRHTLVITPSLLWADQQHLCIARGKASTTSLSVVCDLLFALQRTGVWLWRSVVFGNS